MGEGGEKLAPKVDLGKGKGLAGTGLFPVAWREKRRLVNRMSAAKSGSLLPAFRCATGVPCALRPITPAIAVLRARFPRQARCRYSPDSRSCARHAARWCDRVRQTGARSREATAASAFW